MVKFRPSLRVTLLSRVSSLPSADDCQFSIKLNAVLFKSRVSLNVPVSVRDLSPASHFADPVFLLFEVVVQTQGFPSKLNLSMKDCPSFVTLSMISESSVWVRRIFMGADPPFSLLSAL